MIRALSIFSAALLILSGCQAAGTGGPTAAANPDQPEMSINHPWFDDPGTVPRAQEDGLVTRAWIVQGGNWATLTHVNSNDGAGFDRGPIGDLLGSHMTLGPAKNANVRYGEFQFAENLDRNSPIAEKCYIGRVLWGRLRHTIGNRLFNNLGLLEVCSSDKATLTEAVFIEIARSTRFRTRSMQQL